MSGNWRPRPGSAALLLRSISIDNAGRFERCLEGVSEPDLLRRAGPTTNHMLFLAAHVVDARYFLAGLLGIDQENPLAPFLEGAATIEDVKEYPSISLISELFRSITDQINGSLLRSDDDAFAGRPKPGLPVALETLGEAVAFLLSHESYHLGQLAFLRKHNGYPAVRY
ncbi:MAG: DinB family protein [bacterium]